MRNNRTAGHNYERKIAKELTELTGQKVETSRYASRKLDDQGIDLVNTGDLAIQLKCGSTFSFGDLKTIFGKMKTEDIKTLFLNYQRKGHKGEYVIMPKSEYYRAINDRSFNTIQDNPKLSKDRSE